MVIEAAMEKSCVLLGSKHKAEVLEAMELFRVAHIYDMTGSKVGPLAFSERICP